MVPRVTFDSTVHPQVSESIELAKTAADERDAATLAQSNAEQELSRLQNVIEKLVDEAGQRTAEEVEKVREQANLNIAKLLAELHTVEQVSWPES